ncbi:MAG TPA: spore coat protein U domain-containing protein, partial [Burkholderiales bacterium]|nr:spore coat protein U domain-containing protein [Burkholderiales bacterium]
MTRAAQSWLAAGFLALAASHALGTNTLGTTCSVSAVTLPFGSYNTFQTAPTDTTGNISVTCSGVAGQSVVYAIGLSSGYGTFVQRRMRSSGSSLNY